MILMQCNEEQRALVGRLAEENFKSGLNCAECVCDALMRSGALTMPRQAVAMCTGFGGGIGLSGSVCGAFVAAVMANGAAHGRPDPMTSVPDTMERGKQLAAKYYRRYNAMFRDFAEREHGTTCAEICAPFDWEAKERRKNCLRVIVDTTLMAYDYLIISQEEAFSIPYGKNMAGLKD